MTLLALILAAGIPAATELPTPERLIAASIDHHDPDGRWSSGAWAMEFDETRPGGPVRKAAIRFDNRMGTFAIVREIEQGTLAGRLDGEGCTVTLDGSADIPAELQKDRWLSCPDGLERYRDYYLYLWGMPMKLRDPGTRVGDRVEWADYDGRKVYALRVTYDASVGSDVWYFYFEPETSALVGYRFYHDESKNDGEYIVLTGTESGAGLALPKRRAWYVNADGRHLGSDTVTSIRTLER